MMEQSPTLRINNIFPNEIFQHALALLPLKEIYSFKRVNKAWYRLCDHAIVEHITISGSRIHVRAGTSKNPKLCYDLNFVGYDPALNIFTFQPFHDKIESTFCYLKHLREIRILFGEWAGVNTTLNKYSPSDPTFGISNRNFDPQASEVLRRAKLEFHKNYIESVRKVYQLDEPSLKDETMISCLGDKDIVLKCRITTAFPCDVPNDQLNSEDDDAGGVVYSLRIEFVKVCASWLVSGTTSNFIPEDSRNQIFAPRFNLLDKILAECNITTRYYRYSSMVLKWILSDYDMNDRETIELIHCISSTQGNFSIRSKVEAALEEKNVKKQNMWKYSLVSRFLCDPESYPDPLDMVVDRVVRAERNESDNERVKNHHNPSRFFRGLYFIKMKFILSNT
ncbi:12241_t:CDS:1 [Funneliformis geosporum]|uniref:7376_t:CDS:1 n=1 Tax=Funneliformis geosporum TaxID=1117311 RepID=A0A9W4SBG6_9GLOM|nr:7376_t:CDS:1 [Funneliformis geosporum]CAI2162446.1 12241_t:CDS:1 [Funneliformis geosporum]